MTVSKLFLTKLIRYAFIAETMLLFNLRTNTSLYGYIMVKHFRI